MSPMDSRLLGGHFSGTSASDISSASPISRAQIERSKGSETLAVLIDSPPSGRPTVRTQGQAEHPDQRIQQNADNLGRLIHPRGERAAPSGFRDRCGKPRSLAQDAARFFMTY